MGGSDGDGGDTGGDGSQLFTAPRSSSQLQGAASLAEELADGTGYRVQELEAYVRQSEASWLAERAELQVRYTHMGTCVGCTCMGICIT